MRLISFRFPLGSFAIGWGAGLRLLKRYFDTVNTDDIRARQQTADFQGDDLLEGRQREGAHCLWIILRGNRHYEGISTTCLVDV
jgi:hypothetical protein